MGSHKEGWGEEAAGQPRFKIFKLLSMRNGGRKGTPVPKTVRFSGEEQVGGIGEEGLVLLHTTPGIRHGNPREGMRKNKKQNKNLTLVHRKFIAEETGTETQ